MPPFKLEALRNTEFPKRRQQILYTKKLYSKDVKITDWEMYLESYPRDNDPYSPGKLNYFLSHYKRIGSAPDEPLQSETSRMLSELYEKKGPIAEPNKYLINFCSYTNEFKPKEDVVKCTSDIYPDYVTTMQDSYTMPFPYKMQRFALPKTPWMLNRKIKASVPGQFLDDSFKQGTACLQCVKKSHSISYNPCTALNTDGTPVKEKKTKCFTLEY